MRKAVGRAILYILRTPIRSLVFTSTLFSLLLIIMICLSIQSWTKQSLTDLRSKFGREVVLTQNFSAAGSDSNGKVYVTESLGKKLSGSPYVTDFCFYLWGAASASLNPATSEYSDNMFKITHKNSNETVSKDTNGGSALNSGDYAGTGNKKDSQKEDEDNENTGFILKGYGDLRLESNFYYKRYILAEGSFFTGSDTGSNTVPAVISRLLADANGLKPSSTFYIKTGNRDLNGNDSKNTASKIKIRITGIFDVDESYNENDSLFVDINSIFLPLETVKSLRYSTSTGTDMPENSLTSVTYFLDQASHIDAFRKQAAEYGMDEKAYSLDARDSEYEFAAGSVKRLRLFSIIMMGIAVAAAVSLVFISTFRSLKGRCGEIVLLRSIGTSIRIISFQHIMEFLLLLILAATAAGIAGNALSEPVAGFVMKQQAWLDGWLEDDETSIAVTVKTDTVTGVKPDSRVLFQDGYVFTDNTGKSKYDFMSSGRKPLLLYTIFAIFILLCGLFSLVVYMRRVESVRIVLGEKV